MVAFNQMEEGASAGELPAVARRARELRRLVVKDDCVLWVGDVRGDIYPDWLPVVSTPAFDETLADVRLGRTDGAGLYHGERRVLSCCVLAIQSETLPAPAAAETGTYEACLAFPELRGRRDDLSAFRAFLADGATIRQWITLESQSLRAAPVRVTLTLACDGMLRDEDAVAWSPEQSHLDGATLYLTSRDERGTLQRTAVTFDRAPFDVRWLGAYDIAGVPPRVAVSFHLYPALAEPAVLAFQVCPASIGGEALSPFPSPRMPSASDASCSPLPSQPEGGRGARIASAAVRDRHARDVLRGALYTAHQPSLDATLRRAASDLRLLATRTERGASLPLAGLPDRHEIDGWEALIAGFQSLALDPAYASNVLRGLEWRVMETLADGPDGREPGAPADAAARPTWQRLAAAPLWVALLAETLDWTADRALFEELLPTARQLVRAMERRADRHGYLRADRPVGDERIRLEPQVYVCMARRALARALRRRGSPHDYAEIAALELGAENLRQHVERDFWLGGEGCYAPALDGAWRPLHAATSASAHALWGRVASGPRAARVAARLTAPDLASGWGLRGRSTADAGYDALALLGGAVWTHETAFAAIGLLRNGYANAGSQLARGVFEVAGAQVDARLPAYVGGQHRSGAFAAAPQWCAEASMPSAAAVASPIALVAAMLGCEPDALSGRLVLRPTLPAWLRRLSVQHLRVGMAWIDVDVARVSPEGACEVSARVTRGECAVLVQPPVRAYA